MIDINSIRRNNLKRLLEKYDIEKIELARRIETSPQYINSLLNENKGFSDKAVEKIAIALNVEEIEFYKGMYGEEQVLQTDVTIVAPQAARYIPLDIQADLEATRFVLMEGPITMAAALKSNIWVFKAAADEGKRQKDLEQKIEVLEMKMLEKDREISELKKADQLQLTSVPDFSHPEHPNGLKIVSGGR
jgi:transcriptional regulator with XRE-family HTH domain